MVRVERLLLHKGDVNNVFSTAIAYCSVPYRAVSIVPAQINNTAD